MPTCARQYKANALNLRLIVRYIEDNIQLENLLQIVHLTLGGTPLRSIEDRNTPLHQNGLQSDVTNKVSNLSPNGNFPLSFFYYSFFWGGARKFSPNNVCLQRYNVMVLDMHIEPFSRCPYSYFKNKTILGYSLHLLPRALLSGAFHILRASPPCCIKAGSGKTL